MLHKTNFTQSSSLNALLLVSTLTPLVTNASEVNISASSQVVSWSSQYNNSTWAAKNLLDGKVGAKHEWASTKTPKYPQHIVIDLLQTQALQRVAINPQSTEKQNRWSKEISLFASNTPDGPWQAITNYQLLKEPRFQSISFDPVNTRFLKVSVDSNWGGDYAELGEIQLFANINIAADGSNNDIKLTEISKLARIISWTSQFNHTSWAAENLLDGKIGSGHEWASIAEPKFPHQLIFSLGSTEQKPNYLTRVDIYNKTSEQPNRWSKDISIDVANSHQGPWLNVAEYQLTRDIGYQVIEFEPHKANYMRINVNSNWGGTYAEMAEIRLFSADNGKQITSIDTQFKEIELANTRNIASVVNGPKAFAKFTLKKPTVITKINTYHWNNGEGTPSPGQVGIRQFGSWQAKGLPGMNDAPNAEWWVYPNITLPAGTYTVTDSDAATWSQNQGSGQVGHFVVYGYHLPENE